MGGRRAASLSEFVGPRKQQQELAKTLQSGFESEDRRVISEAAAKLAMQVVPKRKLHSYLGLLVPFVSKQLKQTAPTKDLRKAVRKEWSRLKKKHDIEVSRVVSQAVEQATIDVVRANR